jgi:2-amino-4-hydroxy-6-hydroxymethyldihydropteridine diphosphokinase
MTNMETALVYLAVGTNLGDRRANLAEALAQLPPQVTVEAVSRLYETAPAYVTDQPPFFNIALKGRTSLVPADLLAYLKLLEKKLGRQKAKRYGPRTIDLDILFYDERVVDSPDLQIPHPRLPERAFVLLPLADIAPDLVHPILQQTISALREALPPDNGILKISDW